MAKNLQRRNRSVATDNCPRLLKRRALDQKNAVTQPGRRGVRWPSGSCGTKSRNREVSDRVCRIDGCRRSTGEPDQYRGFCGFLCSTIGNHITVVARPGHLLMALMNPGNICRFGRLQMIRCSILSPAWRDACCHIGNQQRREHAGGDISPEGTGLLHSGIDLTG